MSTARTNQSPALATAFALFIEAARAIMGYRIVTIAVSALPAIEREVAKIARRAVKHGIEAPGIERIGDTFTVCRKDTRDRDVFMTCVRVRLTAPNYAVNGAEFVGALHHTPAGTLVMSHPAHFGRDLSAYRTEDGKRCDHCNTRRKRTRSFVVSTPDGERVVGASCLRDYFGVDVAAAAAWKGFGALWSALLDSSVAAELDSEGGSGGGKWSLGTTDYLARAAYAVYKHGYHKSCMNDSTRGAVSNLLFPSIQAMRDADVRAEVNAAGSKASKAAAAYLRGWIALNMTGAGDFDYNLRIACANDSVHSKVEGFLCYAVEAYRKARGEATKYAKKADRANVHVGTVGERIDMDATITRTMVLDGNYGPRTMVQFLDGDGNTLVWWKSGEIDVAPGQAVKVRGTVKGHDAYKDVNQTTLTRCKVICSA